MNVTWLPLPGLAIIRPRVHTDERGSFFEVWNARKLNEAGIETSFVQENQSYSRCGTLRGLHYQIRQPQGKLVRVVQGAIFDVAVDLRRHEPTFGRWIGTELDARDGAQIYIPPGFAHGFLTLSADATVVYACTDFYAPEHERTLLWNDVTIGVGWPIDRGVAPILSEKDQKGTPFELAEVFT